MTFLSNTLTKKQTYQELMNNYFSLLTPLALRRMASQLTLLLLLLLQSMVSEGQVVHSIQEARQQGIAQMQRYDYVDAIGSFQTAMVFGDSSLSTLGMLRTCYAETKNAEGYQTIVSIITARSNQPNLSSDWDIIVPFADEKAINETDLNTLQIGNTANTLLVSALLDSLQKIWTVAQDALIPEKNTGTVRDLQNLFNSEKLHIDQFANANRAYFIAKERSLKADIGLSAGANYYENFPIQVIDADNLLYRRKFTVGLDWDLFNNGLVEHLMERKVVANEARMNEIAAKTNLQTTAYVKLYNRIIYFFNLKKLAILDLREKIMNMKFPIVYELLNLKQVPRITVIKMEQQMADLQGMQQLYSAYNTLYKDTLPQDSNAIIDLPYFNFDLSAIENVAHPTENQMEDVNKLLQENLKYEANPLNKINLSLKFNYNIYDYQRSVVNKRDFYNLGLVASAPLSLPFDNSKKLLNTQLAMQALTNEETKLQAAEEDQHTFYAIKYKQKQYVNYTYKLNYYQELLRIQRVRNQFKDLNYKPLDALDEIDAYLAAKVEQMDVLQEMYLSLLGYYRKHPYVDLTSYVQVSNPVMNNNTSKEAYTKSIYIWSTAYKQYSASYIDKFLSLHQYSNAIVSLPMEQEKRNLAMQVIKELQFQGKRIEVMIGDPTLLNEDSVANRLSEQLAGVDIKNMAALHLDVEPHTLKDWYSNREELTAKYIKLLESAREFCDKNKLLLSVSIPLSYSDSLLKAVYKNAQHVYLMAYEHKDIDYIQRKTALPLSYGAENTTICLRVKDFVSIGELNQFTEQLTRTMKLDNIGIHDLNDVIMMDNKEQQ